MFLRATIKNPLPALMALMGAGLLVEALPVAYGLPVGDMPLCIASFIAGMLAVAGICVQWVNRSLPARRIGGCLLAIGLFAWSLTPVRHDWWASHALAMQSLSLLGAGLFAAGLVLWESVHPRLAWIGRLPRRARAIPSPLFAWLCYLAFLLLALWLAWNCFSLLPVYTDSEAQYVHAKTVAGGHLYAPSPRFSQFFYVPMSVHDHGRWYSQYPPLHVLMLALGHVFGAPWIINPVEGALTVLVLYALTRRISGESTARLAALLALCSQFLLFMSAEFMNHATSLLFTTLFLLSYVATLQSLPDQTRAGRWALAAGLSLGAVFLARPLTAVGVGLAFGLHALYLLCRQPRLHVRPFLLMALGGIACLGFQAWYDWQLTGDPLVMPYVQYSYRLGSLIGFGSDYTLHYALHKAREEWVSMNQALFEWSAPCMLFVMLACLLPLTNRYLRLLPAMILCFTAVNMFNRSTNAAWGPRYLYETAPALLILTAVGIRRIPLLIKAWGGKWPGVAASQGIAVLLVALLFVPAMVYRLPQNLWTYSHYFDHHPYFYYSMLEQSEKPALIFIGKQLVKDDPDGRYRWITHANPPADDAPVIFAIDMGDEQNARLMRTYPSRHTYVELDGVLYPVEKAKP